jgi:CubicO group peptidase (beta-lactamase class C family)
VTGTNVRANGGISGNGGQMIRIAAMAVCVFLVFPQLACQRDDRVARIEAFCDSLDRPDLPGGFAVAVIQDGRVSFKKAYGFANSEHGIEFTTSTVFEFASVAKQFAGFAVAVLARDGKLDLDDEIHSHLPELPDFGEEITVRHLLYHTSGIRDWVALVKLSGRYEGDAITAEYLMKLARNQRDLNFSPGEEFRYSNLGYFLLARIVERATGQTFRQWTTEQIFQPLGMADTHFCDDYREIVPDRAGSYIRAGNGQYVNSFDQKEGTGSSSLYSTLDDMIKWMRVYQTHELGGEEVWSAMLESGVLNNGEKTDYGFGISFNEDQELSSIGHGGSWAGYLCQISYYPEHEVSTILMINRDPSAVLIGDRPVRIILGEEGPRETEPKATPERTVLEIDPDVLSSYVGAYRSEDRLTWVERANGQLTVLTSGGQKLWIHPEGGDRFFSNDFFVDVGVSFRRAGDGAVNQLVLSVAGEDREPYGKVSTSVTDIVDVGAFLGDYDCPELETTYHVVVRNDRLVLEHLHNEDVVLQRMDRNIYRGNAWWCTEIRVTRDAEDRVTGFKLSADGNCVQDLVFVRRTAVRE